MSIQTSTNPRKKTLLVWAMIALFGIVVIWALMKFIERDRSAHFCTYATESPTVIRFKCPSQEAFHRRLGEFQRETNRVVTKTEVIDGWYYVYHRQR